MLATNVIHLASLNNDWICIQTLRRVQSENPLLLPFFKLLEIPSQSRSVWECSDLSFNYSVDKTWHRRPKPWPTFTDSYRSQVQFGNISIARDHQKEKRIGKRGEKNHKVIAMHKNDRKLVTNHQKLVKKLC